MVEALTGLTVTLAREIEQTLLARLSTLAMETPRRIACVGASSVGISVSTLPEALRARYPDAAWMDIANGANIDLIWGIPNIATTFTPYTAAMFHGIKNALADNGVFFFATLGPQTLLPLQSLCSSATTPHAFATWPTLMDLGNALVAAGLARPVLDRKILTFTYTTAAAALTELMRDDWFDASSCSAEAARVLTADDGSAEVPFEIYYGVAWNTVPDDWQPLRFSAFSGKRPE
jgi:hypothetical protein